MNVREKIILTLIPLFLGACAGPGMIVVQSPPTGESSFTVIPALYSTDEIKFAGQVESQLIKFVRIIERPPFKFMKSDQQPPQAATAGATNLAVGVSVLEATGIIDVVSMYPDSKAAYIVTSYSSTRRIRIVERATNTVVAAIDIPGEDNSNDPAAFENRIYSGLVYAKILPTGFTEKNCKIVNRRGVAQ